MAGQQITKEQVQRLATVLGLRFPELATVNVLWQRCIERAGELRRRAERADAADARAKLEPASSAELCGWCGR